jgi:IS66 Orf2 like protein/Transposase IS66 family
VFGLGPATRIYLAAGVTDMRKGFEGLYGLVRDRLSCEPLSGHLFLFCNAQRNRLKVLVWDGSGLERDLGLEISRATLDGWVLKVGELLIPMVAAMRQELISGSYIQADETPVDVQTREGRGKNHQAYFWQYSRPGEAWCSTSV